MTVLRKSFYIHWSSGRSPRVQEVNPGRDPSIALPFLAEEGLVHHFRRSPRVFLRCAPLWGLGVVRVTWLGWILLPFLHLGEDRGVVALPEGWRYGLPGSAELHAGVASLVSCSNSPIRRWLMRRSASTSSVLACSVSIAPPGGQLSTSPGWSCILGGLALLLLVFRVYTISH